MPITIQIGWWLLPLMVTLVCYLVAYLNFQPKTHSDTYGVGAMIDLAKLGIATIFSLAAWLVYALVI